MPLSCKTFSSVLLLIFLCCPVFVFSQSTTSLTREETEKFLRSDYFRVTAYPIQSSRPDSIRELRIRTSRSNLKARRDRSLRHSGIKEVEHFAANGRLLKTTTRYKRGGDTYQSTYSYSPDSLAVLHVRKCNRTIIRRDSIYLDRNGQAVRMINLLSHYQQFYTYDAAGRLTSLLSLTDSTSRRIIYQYDAGGRPYYCLETYKGRSGKTDTLQLTRINYDDPREITVYVLRAERDWKADSTVETFVYRWTYAFNENGQTLRVTSERSGSREQFTPIVTLAANYYYGADHRLSKEERLVDDRLDSWKEIRHYGAVDSVITFQALHNAAGQPDGMRIVLREAFTYDSAHRCVDHVELQPLQETGIHSQQTYDERGRVVQKSSLLISLKTGSASPFTSERWMYDHNGLLVGTEKSVDDSSGKLRSFSKVKYTFY
jgi:hypothetical protein